MTKLGRCCLCSYGIVLLLEIVFLGGALPPFHPAVCRVKLVIDSLVKFGVIAF